jgi:heme oxygenase
VSAEDVVGTAYVLEGATLGGAVVVRQLPSALPRRFFTSYGDERGARWRAFRSDVEQLPLLDAGAAVAAAERTFGLFEQACLGVRR